MMCVCVIHGRSESVAHTGRRLVAGVIMRVTRARVTVSVRPCCSPGPPPRHLLATVHSVPRSSLQATAASPILEQN